MFLCKRTGGGCGCVDWAVIHGSKADFFFFQPYSMAYTIAAVVWSRVDLSN